MLTIENIDVFYGDLQVLWDVSFEINEGEIVALIGANGAGKTTSIKAISSLLQPRQGSIHFHATPLHQTPAHKVIGLGIAHVPEGRRLFAEMTVEENLLMGALQGEASKKRAQTITWIYELFPRLKERMKQHAGTLSGGEQQMLAIGRGLMSLPQLLMLDEPSLGLAPILVRDIFDIMRNINAEGVTILLVEQNVRQTLALCHRAYILENGRIVHSGPGSALLEDEHVREIYLGV